MKPDDKKTEVAKQKKGEVGDVIDYGSMAGEGYENQTSRDMSIPYIGLTQQLNPELNKKKEDKFISGLEVGDFFNSVTREIIGKADDGFFFVPCFTENIFVEWKPRDLGGGLIGRHSIDSAEVDEARRAAKGSLDLKNGENDLLDTFYLYGLIVDGPEAEDVLGFGVISCTKSKIKPYRKLMTILNSFSLAGGGKPPMFAHCLKVTSREEENAQSQPYQNIVFAPAVNDSVNDSLIKPGNPTLNAAQELKKAVQGGVTKIEGEQDAAGDGTGETSEHF